MRWRDMGWTPAAKPNWRRSGLRSSNRMKHANIVMLTAALLGETPDSPVVREVADWIDLTVGESSAVRKAALALTPAHRTLAVHYYGEKAVRELEELDPQAICREGLAWFDREKSLESNFRRSTRASHGKCRHTILHLFERPGHRRILYIPRRP